jgi:hypothetical protein
MGSLKSGLFAIALTTLVGTAAVVGCSADGGSGIGAGTDPNLPAPDPGVALPDPGTPPDNSIPDAGKDASKKDSGPKTEAGVDAGPPPPVEGTACPLIDAKATKMCGACGTAETLCQDDGTGKGKWSAYGACAKEIANGCIPGTQGDCGNCGKQTCNQYCAFAACVVPVTAVCKPAAVEYTTASCTTPSTYKNRTCSATCAWGSYSATCAAPVNDLVLNIGGAVAAVTSKTITFSLAKVGPRIIGSCPNPSISATGGYPYQYVELHNPTAKAAKVTVYASTAPGGQVVDTVMAVYANPIQPMDDAGRKACRDGANDQSAAADPTGATNFSILKAVAIPAGGSVLVWVGAYEENGDLDLDGLPSVGDFSINTKIETLL